MWETRLRTLDLASEVLTLRPLAEEGRQRDSSQDADDQDDNEQLDEREALLPVVNALAELPQHVVSSLKVTLIGWVCAGSSGPV